MINTSLKNKREDAYLSQRAEKGLKMKTWTDQWYVHYCKMSKSYRGTVPSMNKVDIQIAQIQIDRTAASNVAKAVPKQIGIQINSKHENRSMPFLSF